MIDQEEIFTKEEQLQILNILKGVFKFAEGNNNLSTEEIVLMRELQHSVTNIQRRVANNE